TPLPKPTLPAAPPRERPKVDDGWRDLERLIPAFEEIEPISVSRLVDRMEESGWIERRADATDRRVRMIFPTPKAREAYAQIKSLAGEVYEESLTGVSTGDRHVLIRALEAMAENLADGETPSCEKVKSTEGAAA
ncbi:MAG: MarR family transcriptional regulator, partial [Mesorhizobium sp.]|nr:MarR family transcriptional regulator [Mesorhizobium sp.]